MEISKEHKKIKDGFLGQRMTTMPPNVLNDMIENPMIAEFYITAIGYYPKAIYHDRKRKYGSNEYILLYCVEGSGSINTDGKKYEITANTYFILPPNISHHYQSSSKTPWTIYWCHFLGRKATYLYEYYKASFKNIVPSIARSELRNKDFFKIIDLLETDYSNPNLEYANISFLSLLAKMIYHRSINALDKKSDIISNSIEYLNNNISKTFKVSDIAKQQNLSVSRFTELFKLKTGYSPVQYFNKLKIQKSCQYLYFTDLSMKEICEKIGYDDPYYYSRAFKKLMGMPPSQYRKEYSIRNNKKV